MKFFLRLAPLSLLLNSLQRRAHAAVMIVKVLVASVKMVTSLVGNAKTVIVHVEIVKKVQMVVQIVLAVNSLMHRQNFHSVQKQNAFVHCA